MELPVNFADTALALIEVFVVILNKLNLADFATTLSEKAHELLDQFSDGKNN